MICIYLAKRLCFILFGICLRLTSRVQLLLTKNTQNYPQNILLSDRQLAVSENPQIVANARNQLEKLLALLRLQQGSPIFVPVFVKIPTHASRSKCNCLQN